MLWVFRSPLFPMETPANLVVFFFFFIKRACVSLAANCPAGTLCGALHAYWSVCIGKIDMGWNVKACSVRPGAGMFSVDARGSVAAANLSD